MRRNHLQYGTGGLNKLDKYQRCAFDESNYRFYCYIDETKNYCTDIDLNKGYITIRQDEDITRKGYFLACQCYFEYLNNKEWVASEYDKNNRKYKIGFDFDNPISQIRLVEKNNLVDPLIINVNVILADKNAYYAKKKDDELRSLIEKASIKHSVGKDLINIYFQPCQENYSKTEIEFFIADGIYEYGMGYPIASQILVGGKNRQLIAKFSIENGVLFKSITGLAPGVYAYIVKQYSQAEKLLFETKPKFVQIC